MENVILNQKEQARLQILNSLLAEHMMVEGMSTREAARVFGLHRDTVRKMLSTRRRRAEGLLRLRACYCNKKSSLSYGNIV